MKPKIVSGNIVVAIALAVGCGEATPTNLPPELYAPADQANAEGEEISLQLAATDPDDDALTWGADGLPTGLSLSVDGWISGTLDYTASEGSPWAVTITVSDGALSESADFTWTVTDTNRPPILASPGDQHDAEADDVLLQLEASDPDGDPLHFTAEGLPPGLHLDPESGLIDGALPYGASVESPYSVDVTVSDGELSEVVTFAWTVDFTNQPPVIHPISDQEHDTHTAVSLMVEADDPDGDPLLFGATGLPPGAEIDPDTGWIFGELVEHGLYEVTVTVSDGELEDSAPFTWRVNERPPGLTWTKQGFDLRGSYWVPDPSNTQALADFGVTQTFDTGGDIVLRILVGDITGTEEHHVVWETAAQRVWVAPAADISEPVDLLGAGFRAWLLHDATGDGALEIGVDQTGSNPDIRFYTPDAEQVWRYHASHSGDGAFYPVGAHDGKLWMVMSAGYSRSPRAVRQIDLATTSEDWTFYGATLFWGRAPTISIDETRDRIAMNSGTPHNGASRTITLDDGSSIATRDNALYHRVIDFDGTAHIAQRVDNTRKTGSLGQAILFDGNVLAAEGKDPRYYTGDAQAHLLAPDGEVIQSVVIGRNDSANFAFDKDYAYFHLGRSGTVRRHALDEDLTHDWTVTLPTGGHIIGLTDLSGDGNQELVVAAGSHVYILAAETGDVIREIEVGGALRGGALADLTADGRYEILVGGQDGVYVLSTR